VVANTVYDRLAAEQSRGIYSEDIAMPGSTAILQFAQGDMNEPFLDWMIHPDVLQNRGQTHLYSEWLRIDPPNKYAPVTTARIRNKLALLFYNTNKVSQAEIGSVRSWKDFTKPQWKGCLGIITHPDASGGDTRGLFWRTLGREWWQAMIVDQSPALEGGALPPHYTRRG
jgi:ABC-type Fe3+ transport system substrate-binding protein